jgi:type III secretion protein D
MKRLRILTGRHVGALLDLTPGTYLIGPGDDCDLALTDWTHPPIQLDIAEKGEIAQWRVLPKAPDDNINSGNDESVAAQIPPNSNLKNQGELLSLNPQEFDGIVLCIGPTDAPWPSDVQLLGMVFQPTTKTVMNWAGSKLQKKRVALWSTIGLLLVGGITLASAMTSTDRARLAPALPTVTAVRDLLASKIQTSRPNSLGLSAGESSISITGLVEDAQDAGAVRAAIAASQSPYRIINNFAVATEIAESIRSTAGLPQASVTYIGKGIFNYTADAPNPKATREALDRITMDLSPNVKRIESVLESIEAEPKQVPILSRYQSDGLSIVQTRDRVKHLVINSIDPPIPEGQAGTASQDHSSLEPYQSLDESQRRPTRASRPLSH